MITLISDPSSGITSPEVTSRWLATESPNVFKFQRTDYVPSGTSDSGGYLELTFADPYDGQIGNSIAVYNLTNGGIYVGTVTSMASPATTIVTSIAYVAAMDISYMIDNTKYAGYYIEGRLTVNDVVQALTIKASPDTSGICELDVSGILRIMVTNGKTGEYTADEAAEITKSGKFTLEFRAMWYGSGEQNYLTEDNDWYYCEAVRSIEQGSNLAEFVYSGVDVPFMNAFKNPVYFLGLPFDISFIWPADVGSCTAIINHYNSVNTLLSTETKNLTASSGNLCSLNIDPASIEADCDHMTVEIGIPT